MVSLSIESAHEISDELRLLLTKIPGKGELIALNRLAVKAISAVNLDQMGANILGAIVQHCSIKPFTIREGMYEPNLVKIARTVNAMASIYKGAGLAFDYLERQYEQATSQEPQLVLTDVQKRELLV